MKKAAIIALMLLVLAIVGYFVYTDISVKELTYVSFVEKTDGENIDHGIIYSAKRLYCSGIDIEKFNERLERLVSLEFTEEDIEAAALESGTPEIYPAIYIEAYRSVADEEIYFDAYAVQEVADGQKNTDYNLSDLHLEISTNGVTIKDAKAFSTDSFGNSASEVVLKNESGTAMTVDLGNYGKTNLTLNAAASGSVNFQYTYKIAKNSFLPQTAVEECFLLVRADILTDAEGKQSVKFTLNPSTTVSEYFEQE